MVGWNPDYDDPSTYLDTLQPSSEDQTKVYLGFAGGVDNASAKAVGLDEYAKLLADANSESLDVTKRYEKYAAAQAWLTENAMVLPIYSKGGVPSITKVTPFSAANSAIGIKGETTFFKYQKLQDKTVTTADYEKAYKNWLKEKEESNKKAQEELAKHVK